ncbi:hypothetical protein TNCV_3097451 [Trichonephila clavipes]|nr:hypothetical protein TNCV_3097451 [Trichonephila clavipes]
MVYKIVDIRMLRYTSNATEVLCWLYQRLIKEFLNSMIRFENVNEEVQLDYGNQLVKSQDRLTFKSRSEEAEHLNAVSVCLGHQSLSLTNLGRVDEEMASPGGSPLLMWLLYIA